MNLVEISGLWDEIFFGEIHQLTSVCSFLDHWMASPVWKQCPSCPFLRDMGYSRLKHDNMVSASISACYTVSLRPWEVNGPQPFPEVDNVFITDIE